jgi:4-amino-4-deoxychorismate lyase
MIIDASFDVNQPELWLNRALYYGDGVFETMRCHEATIPLARWHQQRLSDSLERLTLKPFDWQQVTRALSRLPDEFARRCVLKLLVFRAGGGRGYRPVTRAIDWLLTVGECPDVVGLDSVRLGVSKQRLSDQPTLAGLKHLNRLEQVLIADELNQQTVDDVLVLSQHDEVLETTQHNLLLVKDHQLFTPALDRNGVHGVALAWLKSQCQVQEMRFRLDDLLACSEILVANSVRGFRSVSSINGLDWVGTERHFHGKISRMWNTLFSS